MLSSQPHLDIFNGQAPDCVHGWSGAVPTPRRRVISASKRTDIPAFYLEWMVDRCRAGWVDVPNPYRRNDRNPLLRCTHVSLLPEHVAAIVWWSKDYSKYLQRSHEFERYRVQFFHFTVNSRRPDLAWLEPDVPPLDAVIEQMRGLAALPSGPEMVAWRYDPICFWDERDRPFSSWDPEFFQMMCRESSAIGIRRCFVSIADLYSKVVDRIRRIYPARRLRKPEDDELISMAKEMADIAGDYGVDLYTCCEPRLLSYPGFTKGACIDGLVLGGSSTAATDRRAKGREECGCTVHTDIGDYVTQECRFSCVYCYANP
jgi:hypothetical protein